MGDNKKGMDETQGKERKSKIDNHRPVRKFKRRREKVTT